MAIAPVSRSRVERNTREAVDESRASWLLPLERWLPYIVGRSCGAPFLTSPAVGVGMRCAIDAHSYRLGVVVVHIPFALFFLMNSLQFMSI